jgi:hypothetical protein
MADYYNNVIHKIDRRGKLLSIKDMTNDEWDVTEYNNYRFEFVEYDDKTNMAMKKIPFFIDADEITAFLAQISSGNYSKTIKWHTFFAGSSNKGQGYKNVNGNMIPIVKGTESRKLTIGINDAGYFILKVEVANGKVGKRGEIIPEGEVIDSISFGISAKEAVILAKTIETYTIAKKTIGISQYLRNKQKKQQEETS